MEKTDRELLAFWKDTFPMEAIRLYPKLLPKGVELPTGSVKEGELLALYRQLVSKQLVGMLERIRDLKFPVLDSRHLVEQLSASGGRLDAIEQELVSTFRAVDFPLRGFRPTADIASIRTLSYMFASCSQALNECRRKTSPTGEPREATVSERAKCEADFQACSDNISMQIFVALTAAWWRPAFPVHWHPWWRWPEPDPEPPYRRS